MTANAAELKNKAHSLKIETRPFIEGQFIDIPNCSKINKISPVDQSRIPSIYNCDESIINNAVLVAKKTTQSKIWINTPTNTKKAILSKVADLMAQHIEEIALLDTLETGRAFKNFIRDSIPKAIEALRYFIESVDKYYDHFVQKGPTASATITKEPLGVVGIITPWNDPMVVSIWKIAPALLMGNSLVVKPAEQSSYSILFLAKLFQESGLPDGVLNIVTGYGEVTGKALALHNDVRGIFFTGSSAVGKEILKYSGSSNMKKVGLECGGKSPYLVSKNCKNLKTSAKVLARSMFYNQGQICSAPSRLIIDSSIKGEFLSYLYEEATYFVPRDPFDTDSEVGCIISEEHKAKVINFINSSSTYSLTSFSPEHSKTNLENASYVLPTIIELADQNNQLARSEIFGPVIVVISTASLDESITLANDSNYGLAAAIWTDDLFEAHHASRELQAGIVHINSYGDDDNTVPFGGIKESGIGKDKSLFAFDEYTYSKSTWLCFDANL